MQLECSSHGLTKHTPGNGRPRCIKCGYEAVKRRRYKIKDQAVQYKGGCCQICGYSKHSGALEFHHTDPAAKDFQIAVKANISWDKIQKELDKCVLLCANCHREVHAGVTECPV